ncbi:MAG: DNA gyrase C-terminal beta-propeller domain-containing protein, partial [Ginsengibacter sp.]
VAEYRITNRGGKGVKTINVTEKTGKLIGLLNVNETQDLMITCKSGVTIRTSIASIREMGRSAQGVKLIKIDEGDEIAAITNINEREVDEDVKNDEISDENISLSVEIDGESPEISDINVESEMVDDEEEEEEIAEDENEEDENEDESSSDENETDDNL